jgi:predicted 2-oxoglutarate/Fe(II)-dependent dioxygenase YbiX
MISKELEFEQNKYIYLSNFLDKENCNQYVLEFKKLIDQGLCTKDPQCPLSWSIGHSPLFDSLLEQLTPNMEAATGKKLFPTYAYARWYAPGDELKVHRDRPSCEISATINLGFEGNPWPIFMGYNKDKKDCRQINMNVSDAVIYKGCELYHWREKYTEGNWQVQVFIHYVDQGGPYTEYKYDKRDKLAHHGIDEEFKNEKYVQVKNAFSFEACEKMIQNFEERKDLEHTATIGYGEINKEIRDAKKIILDNSQGVGATLTGIGLQENYKNWRFNITHSNQSEYLSYDKSGHFSTHIDTFVENFKELIDCRKLTVLLFLNDNFEGGKFYLMNGENKVYPRQNPGDVIVFPSFLMHGVEPVTSGIRKTIVTWMVGPYFK